MLRGRLAVAAATAVSSATAAAVAGGHFEGKRRSLEGCTVGTVPAAVSSLRKTGVAVVEGVVDQGTISTVKATDMYRGMPLRAGQRPTNEWRLSAPGRFHRREETFGEKEMEVVNHVEKQILPLVLAFFEDNDADGTNGIYRSELQLMNAVPGSDRQMWHRDNRSRGLTVIVPLEDFTAGNGATQVLVGSHDGAWPLLAREGARVMEAPAGGIAAYDSRTFHRGLGNTTRDARPGLIFCYDRTWSPPPGCGELGSLASGSMAAVLHTVSAGWRAAARRNDREGQAQA